MAITIYKLISLITDPFQGALFSYMWILLDPRPTRIDTRPQRYLAKMALDSNVRPYIYPRPPPLRSDTANHTRTTRQRGVPTDNTLKP